MIEIKGLIKDFQRLVGIAEQELCALEEENRPREWRAEPVNIRLGFGWADQGETIPALRGEIETTIAAVCQRCLEPFGLPLSVTLNSVLLEAAEDGAGLDGFDTWELEGDLVQPKEIVEEALIMALPLQSLHPDRKECGPLAGRLETGAATSEPETVRPFADLKSRMDKSN